MGLTLLLDDMPQFTEANEYRYHECLAVAPALFNPPRRVFIGGGGDGLAAARLLRFDGVEQIVLCDYDPGVTGLFSEHEDLVRLNDGALNDERVTVLNEDAAAWLEASHERFDLIILDFPDPYFLPLGRLYSVDFYRTVYDRLTDDGVMVTQTLTVPAVTRIIRSTVGEVFEFEGYYRPYGGVGFTLGSKRPFARKTAVPPWTMFLSGEVVDALFVLPKDIKAELNPTDTPPNIGNGVAVVEAALVHGMSRAIAEPHPYRPNALDVYLTTETLDAVTEEQARLIVVALDRTRELVIVVSDELAKGHDDQLTKLGYSQADKTYDHYKATLTPGLKAHLGSYWQRLDDGSVTAIDVRTVRPEESPEIKALLGRYLADFGHRFYDAPRSQLDLSARGRFVTTQSADGSTVGLFKLLERPEGTELEILYGLGEPRQTLLSLILVLNYLMRIGVELVECFVPTGVFGKSLTRLGAERVDTLRIYTKD